MMWVWALLPITMAVFGTLGIWAVFGIAVSNGSVNLTTEFPYISTCGTYHPQSCAFGQITNICSLLGVWIVVLRFQQIRDYGQRSWANVASIVLGFISALGISIVGNFQQSVLIEVHLLGAFLAFFVGLAYFWLQVWLTYRCEPSTDRRWLGPLRAILCSFCTALILSMMVLHNINFRSASAICEWLVAMTFFAMFGLFAAEFRHMDCHRLTVQRRALGDRQQAGSSFGLAKA